MNYKLLTIHYKLFLLFCTVMLTSCNLFIDEDLERQLLEYSGRGYDEVVTETTGEYTVDYQYKKTTLELNADNPLTSHIVRVEGDDELGYHYIWFDSSTPREQLPRPGQCIVSTNLQLFPYGLCDLVGIVREENGMTVVVSGHTDVRNAFDSLEFTADMACGDDVTAYDVYDEEGNFVAHVGPPEEQEEARLTRGGDEAGSSYYQLEIPFGLPQRDYGSGSVTADIDMRGSLKAKLYAKASFSMSEGFKCDFHLKDGTYDLGLIVKISGKVKRKLFGKNDINQGRTKLTVGPVVVVPVLGVSVNLNAEGKVQATFHHIQPFDIRAGFDGEDTYSQSHFGEPTHTIDYEASAALQLPILKISVGFGLYTSALSLRTEIYITLETKVQATATFDMDKVKMIEHDPKLTCDLKFGYAFALVAEGAIIEKFLEKIDNYLKEKATAVKAIEKAVHTAGYIDWIRYKEGKTLDPNVKKDIEEKMKAVPASMRDKYIDMFAEQALKNGSNKTAKLPDDIDWDNADGQKLDRDKEFALRLGPFYPAMFNVPLLNAYLFPKMREGSFRMGRNWDSKKEKLVFTAEYILEDPGLFSMYQDYYPGFLIKLGSEEVLYEMANNGEKLNNKTPSGKKFSASFPGLAPDQVYTCVPGYAVAGRERPDIWDKALTFSATTPSISITDLKVTKTERHEQFDDKGNPAGVTYSYAFDTYCDVKGSRNVSEWGLIDLNDNNEQTRIHTSKSASLKSGQYIHHWSIKNTRKSKVKISLQPYLFAKDGNKSNWDEAKFFPRYDAEIRDDYDFSESRAKAPAAAPARPRTVFPIGSPAGSATGFDAVRVELDSVTYLGERVL